MLICFENSNISYIHFRNPEKKNRRIMNSSSKIDKKCIAEAVLPSQEPLLDFSAGYVLPAEISLPSIKLDKIGNINIPVSLLV
jgi:hypothetical protein